MKQMTHGYSSEWLFAGIYGYYTCGNAKNQTNRGGRESCVRDGRIVERGKHRDLVHAGGTYQELYETQFSKAMETQEM